MHEVRLDAVHAVRFRDTCGGPGNGSEGHRRLFLRGLGRVVRRLSRALLHGGLRPRCVATGARGLRSIIENLLLDAMFEVPDMDDVTEVIVEKETVEEGEKPSYKKSKTKKKKKSKENKTNLKDTDSNDDGDDDDDVPEKEAS